jgi:hypothetical protein
LFTAGDDDTNRADQMLLLLKGCLPDLDTPHAERVLHAIYHPAQDSEESGDECDTDDDDGSGSDSDGHPNLCGYHADNGFIVE